MTITSFASCLRAARAKAGLTQERLASESGVSLATIRNLEQGHRGDPRLSTLTALARALGLTISELVEK